MFLLGEEAWTPPSPRLAGYSNSGCLAGSDRAAEADQDQYPWCGGDEIEITVEDNTIRILHRNATYNCCPDDIRVTLSVQGNELRLTEEEVLTTPCDCLCCYDVASAVADLLPGTYLVQYCWHDYETGEECRSEEVEIP
jgi:hypothetical protein